MRVKFPFLATVLAVSSIAFFSCKSSNIQVANQTQKPVMQVERSEVVRTFPGIADASITDRYQLTWTASVSAQITLDSIVMQDKTIQKLQTLQDRKFMPKQFNTDKGAAFFTVFERIIDRSQDSKQFDSQEATIFYTVNGTSVKQVISGFTRLDDILAP